ncbi:MAG: hypothetical protein AB7K73_07670 [Gammaproteobacteria bacterium]
MYVIMAFGALILAGLAALSFGFKAAAVWLVTAGAIGALATILGAMTWDLQIWPHTKRGKAWHDAQKRERSVIGASTEMYRRPRH